VSLKKKQIPDKRDCPECASSDGVGFLGGNSTKKYFCSKCCREFNVKGTKISIFEITSGGTIQNLLKK